MVSISTSHIFQIYRPVLYFSACLLAALSASRLVLIAIHFQRVEAVDGLLYVLLQGVRFDFIITCIFSLPVALFTPFLSASRNWGRLVHVYFVCSFFLVLFMEAATPTFIQEYDLRPNILFVEYLKYPREVGMMLLGGYKLAIFCGLAVVLAATVLFSKKALPRVNCDAPRMRLAMALTCSLFSLLVCIAGIRSSLGHRPANPAKVAFSQDLLVNDLSLNSLYSVSYAIYSTGRHERKMKAYGRMDFNEVVNEVRQEMAIPAADFLSPDLPTLHRSAWVKRTDRPLNLVIILQESMGAEFVGALGGAKVTPELDALATEGIWFDELYATGTRSVRGIEAIVTGFTPTPARSVVKLPKSQSNFFTIAELLGQRGYDTSFIYGGEAHFDNMRQFFVGNGFQKIIEEKDFVNPVFKGSWGVSDGDLFARAHEEFSRMGDRPFFSLVFTSSNHSPFEFPENAIDLHEQPQDTVNNAVKYADHAMGEFFRAARKSNYWGDTLFLVVADHNSRVRGANLVPIEHFHIPALILGGSVRPQSYSRLASQIDLLPTLLGLMGVTDPHPATGQDLFRPDIDDIPGRAIMQYNSTQAYMQGDQVVIMELEKAPALYRRTDDGLVAETSANPALIQRALAYSIWSSEAYTRQLYRLPDSSLSTKPQQDTAGRDPQ